MLENKIKIEIEELEKIFKYIEKEQKELDLLSILTILNSSEDLITRLNMSYKLGLYYSTRNNVDITDSQLNDVLTFFKNKKSKN